MDKRDPYTSKHSWRVKEIAGDIGRAMRLSEADLEALEWGGLLHDVGKIGVPDNVLLKQERLNKEERMLMNAHPVLGAQIIAAGHAGCRASCRSSATTTSGTTARGTPTGSSATRSRCSRGSSTCADAFEAMTAQRPYRMTPLTAEQALGELRKFAGIQFDPKVVDAFVRTTWVEGVNDPGRTVQSRPIPMIAQHANRAAANAPPLSTATCRCRARRQTCPEGPPLRRPR